MEVCRLGLFDGADLLNLPCSELRASFVAPSILVSHPEEHLDTVSRYSLTAKVEEANRDSPCTRDMCGWTAAQHDDVKINVPIFIFLRCNSIHCTCVSMPPVLDRDIQ